MRHVIAPARVLGVDGGMVSAQTNYAVFRTRPGDASELFIRGPVLELANRGRVALPRYGGEGANVKEIDFHVQALATRSRCSRRRPSHPIALAQPKYTAPMNR